MGMLIAVSQRVDLVPGREERRDALDQRWAEFLAALGCRMMPIPNNPAVAGAMLADFRPDGVLLTGGNDVVGVGGNAPERDATESLLIRWAADRHLPLLGVCRGLQMLSVAHGGTLRSVDGHAGTRHEVRLAEGARPVNSYHHWGLDDVPAVFDIVATTPDGQPEAIRHRQLPMLGIMWHPEREQPFQPADLKLIGELFGIVT